MENLKSAAIGAVVALAFYLGAQWLGSGRATATLSPASATVASAAPTPVSIILRIEPASDAPRAQPVASPSPVLTPTTVVSVRVLDSLPTIVIQPPPGNKPQSGTIPPPKPSARAAISPQFD